MVYELQTYNLIGKTIVVFQELPDYEVIKGKHGERDKFKDESGNTVESNRFRTFTDDFAGFAKKLQENEKQMLLMLDKNNFPIYLPYFANVTEDLPGYAPKSMKPRTWEGCQLLTQKHGVYLEFYHHETKKTLRIAINSNIYEPAN